MKTHSRKKLLVSSVAMTLVAAVSLGTATFAWFTSSTTATASGINVATAKVSNLQISKSDKNWTETVAYGFANTAMHPVSSANGTEWFTAAAAAKDAFTKTGDFAAQTNSTGYWYAEQLNIKNNGGAAVSNVKINIAVDCTAQDYLRIALVPANDEGTATGNFTTSVFDNAAVAYDAASGIGDATTAITPTTTATGVSVGSLDAGAAAYYNLYVWFEGQDTQCYDVNAAQTINDITFTITGDTGVE